ncbi:MAG: hypothetical protein FGM46_05850 [Ferruginibacter sp.]|nr:hypothetical protein [Ferruginibacter sp.]
MVALSHSITQTHSYAVVLGEVDGLRRLPIVIGGFEAQAIAVALERMAPDRPLTHDLMKNFMLALNVDLNEVLINYVNEGVFHATLICSSANEDFEIDSRTSDALALAVRFGCPIYTYENILEESGIVREGEKPAISGSPSITSSDGEKEDLKSMSTDDLNEFLNEVLENEDYIKAIAIRDELKRRGTA